MVTVVSEREMEVIEIGTDPSSDVGAVNVNDDDLNPACDEVRLW